MAQVYIPAMVRTLTGGRDVIEVSGSNVREVIEAMESQYPGIKDRLCCGDGIRSGLSVVVDGSVSGLGLLQSVTSGTEIHFVPAVGGG